MPDQKQFPGLIAIAALLVFGMYVSPASQPATNGSGSSAGPAAGRPAPKPGGPSLDQPAARGPTYDPLQPLVDFRGGEFAASREGQMTSVPGYKSRFLVATVPDPVDSRFSYSFDSAMSSLQRAAEAAEFVLDRYQLPWHPPGPKGADPATAAPNSNGPGGGVRDFETHPGLLLFRGTRTRELLFVFLVGETPTFGVHKIALQAALDLIAAHLMSHEGETPFEIGVMGPVFSGSQESLEIALRDWSWRRRWQPVQRMLSGLAAGSAARLPDWTTFRVPGFRFVSGSATSIDVGRFQSACWPTEVSFQATVIPDSVLMDRLFDHLHDKDPYCQGKIALLVEGGTAYGSNQRQRETVHPPVVIPFPLHISQVRSAVGGHNADKNAVASHFELDRSRIPIPFDAVETAREVVPPFAPSMTQVADDLVLGTILATICAEQFRYVGIFATDARDKIFLAGLIHRYCPDVQLFTTDSDLLLTHRDENVELRGTLIATSYPLLPAAQLWCFPWAGKSVRMQFSDQSAQGWYNATLALLGHPDLMLDYGLPFDTSSRGSTRQTAPALWFNAVGHNGLYPLDVQEVRGSDSGYVLETEALEDGHPVPDIPISGLYLTFLAGFGAFCLWNIGAAVRSWRTFRLPRDRTRPGEANDVQFLWPRAPVTGDPDAGACRRLLESRPIQLGLDPTFVQPAAKYRVLITPVIVSLRPSDRSGAIRSIPRKLGEKRSR